MKKVIFLSFLFSFPVQASEPTRITADEIIFDHKTGQVTAQGGVKAQQGDTKLSAPNAVYDTTQKSFTSWGGLTVEKENGESFQTDSIHTQNGLENASLDSLKLDLSDGATLEAKNVQKAGEKIVLRDPSYTACDRKDCPLTWEIRAHKIAKNGESLSYQHAWLNLWDVPIFYTPYLSHPTPKARRQSGLLFPKLGSSTDLGSYVQLPYYITLSPTHDLTLTPMTTEKEGEAFGLTHRKNFKFGQTRTTGLYTDADSYDQSERWYASSQNQINLTRVWRGFLDLNRVSDDTFLRKYDIEENKPYLETRGGIEGLWNRSYLTLRFHNFQDLREDTTEPLPTILPVLNYQRTLDPFRDGSFFQFNLNAAGLKYKNDGTNNRVTGQVHWIKPLLMDNGWKWTLDLSSRVDAYTYDTVPLETGGSVTDDILRITPQAMLQWEWAFMKTGDTTMQTLTPIVQLVTSPREEYNEIINTDSQGLRLDDTNLFSQNRFAGYDEIETGTRINYGLDWNLFGQTTGKLNAFVGQSYRFDADTNVAQETSLRDGFSDYVGRVIFEFSTQFKSAYRVQMNKDTLGFNRQELDFFLDLDSVYFQTNYIFNEEQDASVTDISASEELYAKTFFKVSNHWGTYLYDRYNFTRNEQTEMGLGFIYEDDCFRLDIGARREYTQDRDYQGDDSVFINFTFKTLGTASMGRSWEQIKNENRW